MSEIRRVRVTCENGDIRSLCVTDAETGGPIRATAVSFIADFRDHSIPQMTVTTYDADVDFSGPARILRVCPACKQQMEAERRDPKPIAVDATDAVHALNLTVPVRIKGLWRFRVAAVLLKLAAIVLRCGINITPALDENAE